MIGSILIVLEGTLLLPAVVGAAVAASDANSVESLPRELLETGGVVHLLTVVLVVIVADEPEDEELGSAATRSPRSSGKRRPGEKERL